MISIHNTAEQANQTAKGWEREDNVHFVGDVGHVARFHFWSPIIWKDGVRLKDNFIRADYIGLDFDGNMTIDEAVAAFKDYQYWMGTTRNHQIEKKGVTGDRFRVILQLSETVTDPEVYSDTVTELVEKFGCDDNAKDNARFFFPCIRSCAYQYPGQLVKPVKKKTVKQYELRYKKARNPKDCWPARQFLKNPPQAGSEERGRNRTCFYLAKDMMRMGYRESEVLAVIWESGIISKSFKESEVLAVLSSARKHSLTT